MNSKRSAVARLSVVALLLLALLVQPGLANETLTEDQFEDLNQLPIGPTEPECKPGPKVCFDVSNFKDAQTPAGIADPFSGPDTEWSSSHISFDLCCSSDGSVKQRLRILEVADQGAAGHSDCRQTPINNIDKGCNLGGDVSMARRFFADPGQNYSATAWVKLANVNEPEPGMFRARLTIHGWSKGIVETECNAFLRSTQDNQISGSEDQTAVFVPITIPECPMVDQRKGNDLDDVIEEVSVYVRANNFKNDIAYGTVLVQRVVFARLDPLP